MSLGLDGALPLGDKNNMKNPVMALLGLLMAVPPTQTVVSRRAQLAARREQFVADVAAEANPISKIAVGFILIAIALVIALTVLPLVADSVALTQASANVTGSSDTLLGLLPLLLIVGLVVGALAFLISGFRDLREQL